MSFSSSLKERGHCENLFSRTTGGKTKNIISKQVMSMKFPLAGHEVEIKMA